MWQPSADLDALRQRAAILADIRAFFAERKVLEVDTPLLSHTTVTDPHVVGIPALFRPFGHDQDQVFYLQTSPEYAMKRLLASGIGSIYQLGKVFRQGDLGRLHNPEFTMLEWYHVGFDHHQLMDEVDALLQIVFKMPEAKRRSFQALFEEYCGINPHATDVASLAAVAKAQGLEIMTTIKTVRDWLDVLWSHCIEPFAANEYPLFVYDFPVVMASLARVRQESPCVASRFEVYYKGVELGNGFHELGDTHEQAARFATDLSYRAEHQLPELSVDQRLLAALKHGLPDCAGIAMGVDRLIMIALQRSSLEEVVSFAFDRA